MACRSWQQAYRCNASCPAIAGSRCSSHTGSPLQRWYTVHSDRCHVPRCIRRYLKTRTAVQSKFIGSFSICWVSIWVQRRRPYKRQHQNWQNGFKNSPRQSSPVPTCLYPSGQTHMNEPTRFLHAWRQLLAGVRHSSTSTWKEYADIPPWGFDTSRWRLAWKMSAKATEPKWLDRRLTYLRSVCHQETVDSPWDMCNESRRQYSGSGTRTCESLPRTRRRLAKRATTIVCISISKRCSVGSWTFTCTYARAHEHTCTYTLTHTYTHA